MKKSVEKGITLIALVVTIVVLLILAGISISMLTGENGVITQAREAKEQTIIGDEKEGISLAYSSCKADNMMENITASQLEERMKSDGKDVTVTQDGLDLKVLYPKTGHEYTVNQNGKIDNDSSENPDEIIDGIVVDNYHVIIEKASGETVLAEIDKNSDLISTENATLISQNGILQKGNNFFVDKQGKVYTWGYNKCGQLGDGTTTDRDMPECISDIEGSALNSKKISKISNVIFPNDIEARIALDTDGKVYAWGYNVYEQLGDGTKENILIPKCISDIEGSCLNEKKIIDVSANLGLDDNGKVYNMFGSVICASDMSGNILNGKKIIKINFDGYCPPIAIDTEGKTYVCSSEGVCINEIEGSPVNGKKITNVYSHSDIFLLEDTDRNVYINSFKNNEISTLMVNNVKGIVQYIIKSSNIRVLDTKGMVYEWQYSTTNGEISDLKCLNNQFDALKDKKIVSLIDTDGVLDSEGGLYIFEDGGIKNIVGGYKITKINDYKRVNRGRIVLYTTDKINPRYYVIHFPE